MIGFFYRIFYKKKILARKSLRKVKYSSLKEANKILVLINMDIPLIEEAYDLLVDSFEKNSIEYSVLAYSFSNKNEILAKDKISQNPKVITSPRRSHNIFQIPISKYVDDFLDNTADILIDMTFKDKFVFQYLINNSLAHFKVTTYKTNKKEADMIVDGQMPHDEISPAMYAENILKYLSTIITK